jgi:CheY-like chemotaxis protein
MRSEKKQGGEHGYKRYGCGEVSMAVETALVVDDSKSARVMLSRLLKKSGVNVAFAESAEEAFDYLNEAEPDLIFMDHMMPGMDGLHAVKLLAADARFAHIPVVMYTSKEDDGYLAKARLVGAVGVIGKPAKPALVERVLTDVNSLLVRQPKQSVVPKPSMPATPSVGAIPELEVAEPALPPELDIPKIEMAPGQQQPTVKAPTIPTPAAASSAQRSATPPTISATTAPASAGAAASPIVTTPTVKAPSAATSGGGKAPTQTPASTPVPAPMELASSLSKLSVSQVRTMVELQVEGMMRDQLPSRVAEAVSNRLHEIVDGIKSGIMSEIEQEQLQRVDDLMQLQETSLKDLDEVQKHISTIYEQLSNYRDRLRDLDTKSTDVEHYVSELQEKFVGQQEFKDQLEEMKDYIHKEVLRQFKPLEVALKQGLQVLDPENDDYQQFAVQLARDLYPVFETRVSEKISEIVQAALPDKEAENNGNMRVISGSVVMAGLSLVISVGLAAFVALKLM